MLFPTFFFDEVLKAETSIKKPKHLYSECLNLHDWKMHIKQQQQKVALFLMIESPACK